ncbi:MAG: hypothetical protein H0X51_04515 [Parachlamydiaceae bacterium]|nr:hypothetical protein [Parachlamydiaceae bacterium]
MTKHNTPSDIDHLTGNSWEENSFVQWLSQYRKHLIVALLAAAILIFFIVRLVSNSELQSEKDYLTADKEFLLFARPNAEANLSQDSLAKLQAIMQRHPDLHAKYDGLIAQILLIRQQTPEAITFANLALDRTSNENQPYYTAYAQTSLLIGQQNYTEALDKAQKLQENLLADPKHAYGDTLLAFNLLRIASLQQQLGLAKEEKQTWTTWQQLFNDPSHPAFKEVSEHFQHGKVSLHHFIQAREASLKNIAKS